MVNKSIAVIGAGPAGLTAAYKLAQKGVKATVYEADSAVGGMAKTISLWGQLVDLGPHRFFSSDPRVNNIWLEMARSDYSMVSRLTRIYYKTTFFNYPLRAANALRGLGLLEAMRCVLSYAKAVLAPIKDESTFEAWVTNRFGARLFQIFFKSYSEKLWGISCRELDADFAAQRIKKFSLFEAIRTALVGSGGQSKHKTLVDEFAYPNKGAGAVYQRMAERIIALGGEVKLQTPVAAVRPGEKPVVKLESGEEIVFDHVISSMPITWLVRQMDAPQEVRDHVAALKFRNTILVYLRLACPSPFSDQWIYVHSPELKTGRISNFQNWVPSINNGSTETIICLEYWCYDQDSIWSRGNNELVALAIRETYGTSLVPDGAIREGKVVRLPRCYPVYSTGYKAHLDSVEKFLSSQPGVTAIGRYGAFKYNNQDHSILMGLLAAENVIDGAKHNLWAVNTDYEYQESSKIIATGLVKV